MARSSSSTSSTSSTASSAQTASTSKRGSSRAAKQAASRRALIQLGIIAVVVVALVGTLYFFLDSRRNAPETPPREIAITASFNGTDVTTTPFQVCALDAKDCPEGDVAFVDTSGAPTDAIIRIKVPEEIASRPWSLLGIYDDPAANTERAFLPAEAQEVDVPVTLDRAEDKGGPTSIAVVEISTHLVDIDSNGEETPAKVTWSFTTIDSAE